MFRSLILLFIFLPSLVYAQKSTLLKGNITTQESDSSFINIINLTQRTGTVSMASGDFEIRVRENDSLLFSSIQYENLKIKVSAQILRQGFLEIYLKKANNRLEEVRISNNSLTGNLQQDIENIELYKPRLPLYTPGPDVVTRKLHAMSSPMDPVGMLYGALSGEKKKLKKAKANMAKANFVKKAYSLLRPEIFTETLGLKQKEIMDFLYYCREDERMKKMVEEEQKLDLIGFFKEKLPQFIEIRRLD